MAFLDYADITKIALGKIRPKILEQMSKQNAFYSHYLGYKNSLSGKEAPVSDQYPLAWGYATIQVQGVSAQPDQFQFSENAVWTTQTTTSAPETKTTTSAPETWYTTNSQYFEYAGGSIPPVVVAAPAPPEEVPEVPPVEPKRGRMIKLGRK